MSWKHLYWELLQGWKPDFVSQRIYWKTFLLEELVWKFLFVKMNLDSEAEIWLERISRKKEKGDEDYKSNLPTIGEKNPLKFIWINKL